MSKHTISDAAGKAAWQALFICSSNFQLFSDTAKLAAKGGRKRSVLITDMAAGSADLSLGRVFLTSSLTLAHIPAPSSR